MYDSQITTLINLFKSLKEHQSLWWTDSMYEISSIGWHHGEDEVVAYCTRDHGGGYLALSNCEPDSFAVMSSVDVS